MVGHVGARLLADVAEATGLVRAFGEALAATRQRASRHDPGRVAVDLAVMLADGDGRLTGVDRLAPLTCGYEMPNEAGGRMLDERTAE